MPGLILKTVRIMLATVLASLLFVSTGCKKTLGLKDSKTDPLSIFDEVWNEMDQHYAMFTVKQIDWKSKSDEYRLMIHEDMSDKELFDVISKMLETLRDGHVSLISSFDTATYDNFFKPYPTNFNFENIVNNYLQNDYKVIGPVIVKVVNNTGYIYYKSFENNISDADITNIFSEIAYTKGLIIDVRNNSGGNSDAANRLFSRLTPEKKLVKYELRKNGPAHDDFLDPQPFYISSVTPVYTYRAVVLTNRRCFSACNDFVMYMSGLSNVTIMGDQTGGGGGIPQDYILANGWKLQFTATITLSPKKEIIENGILPKVNVNISPIDESLGKDPILEQAFQFLQ